MEISFVFFGDQDGRHVFRKAEVRRAALRVECDM